MGVGQLPFCHQTQFVPVHPVNGVIDYCRSIGIAPYFISCVKYQHDFLS